jgi:hypothetical protein
MHKLFLEILMSLLKVIFYQVQHVHDIKVFKTNMNNIDSLTPNFWMENTKCYELKQVMYQSDEQFINILNRFRISTQS